MSVIFIGAIVAIFIILMIGGKIYEAPSSSKALGYILIPLCMLLALVPIAFTSTFFACFMECADGASSWLQLLYLLLFSYPLTFFFGFREVVQDKSDRLTMLMYGHVVIIMLSVFYGVIVIL